MRHTTFRFTLVPTPAQEIALRRNAGAARFAFNQSLRLVRDALRAKKEDASVRVPWSGFDLINAFNEWKRSPAAGVDNAGRAGLPWRDEVCQQVFEEAAVDLGRALATFTTARKAPRRAKRTGFPKFKKKSSARPSFRIRNKTSTKHGKTPIRLGEVDARSVTLPKLGVLRVREDTRKLRRMLRAARARILFATVSSDSTHWTISLNVEAAPLHEAHRHRGDEQRMALGIDRGLTTFAVVADSAGHELERIESPRPLRRALPRLRRHSRLLSRKNRGSRNRGRARARLSRLHQRVGNVRRDFAHRESSRLAKNHGLLVIEDLCTAGLMRTRLARAIADSGWAMFATMLAYKMMWRDGRLEIADRFYPSTRRCSACGHLEDRLSLSERTFRCSICGQEADRDTNAAANLAQWPRVAAKHAETQNVCGERSAGERGSAHETPLGEAERASARRPRRAVLPQTVNTL